MNARDPLQPLQPDEASALGAFAERVWDEEIVPALTDYIAIPAKSPLFDPTGRRTATSRSACRSCGSRRPTTSPSLSRPARWSPTSTPVCRRA